MEQEKKQLFVPDKQQANNENQLDFSYIKEEVYKPILKESNFVYEFRFPAPTNIEIKKSTIEGIGVGVFTNVDIQEGDIIERVRTLTLANRKRYQHDQAISDYSITDSCECKECSIHGPMVRIMTGFGSFYNHQDGKTQNCMWIISNPYNFLDIVAIKDIKAGEELFLNYGSNYFKTRQYKEAPINQAE
jgi:hypothetical protein